ncbi:MAG: hypothetical protein RLZZ114_500 [Bacteroidota bacterium]|jgi:AraC-like DNA-binding protein
MIYWILAIFVAMLPDKNTAKRKAVITAIDEGVTVGLFPADATAGSVDLTLPAMQVHLFWALTGPQYFQFSPHYGRELPEGQSFFLFNPKTDQPVQLQFAAGGEGVGLSLTFDKLHRLFMTSSENDLDIPFLQNPGTDKPVYEQRASEPTWNVVLKSLLGADHAQGALHVLRHGLILQLLGLYFDRTAPNTAACPFLRDQETVRKLKDAKEHLLRDVFNPPTLRVLSKQHGLNEYQLKVGFKEIYGTTVYGYVMDAKLQKSRLLLDSGRYSVNEVAFQVGYQNPSHYIAAFKKKFGTTPKKYTAARGA